MADNNSTLVAPSQNSFLDSFNLFTSDLTQLGQGAANIYSSFVGAQTTAKLAASQKAGVTIQPTASPISNLLPSNASPMVKDMLYVGIAGAVLLTSFLLFKHIK